MIKTEVKRLVVFEHMETMAFNEVTKTLYNLDDGEKFPVVSTAISFSLGELMIEEGNWLPGVVDEHKSRYRGRLLLWRSQRHRQERTI